ncbi:semaphorin-2A-like [Sergentomyia squamirostris]
MSENFAMMQKVWKMLVSLVLLLLLADRAHCDYENTWNFYYEQPCCGNTNGQHHLRHHRGEIFKVSLPFYFFFYSVSLSLPPNSNYISQTWGIGVCQKEHIEMNKKVFMSRRSLFSHTQKHAPPVNFASWMFNVKDDVSLRDGCT